MTISAGGGLTYGGGTTVSGGTTGLTPATPTAGDVTLAGVLVGANGGTGVANTGKTLTLGGNINFAGSYAVTVTSGAPNTALNWPVYGTNIPTLDTVLVSSFTAGFSATSRPVWVSNAGTRGSLWIANGTRWVPVGGTAPLSSLDAASANIANAETIVHQYLMPTRLWGVGDRLRIVLTGSKSGTTDTMTLRIRIGTAGTTSDTQVFTGIVLTAANRVNSYMCDIRLASDTTAQMLGAVNAPFGYSTAGATAFPAAVTISSASSNDLWVSLSILSSGASNTVNLQDAQISLVASAN